MDPSHDQVNGLAGIYRDSCELAFDEVYEPEYTIWAGELSLSTFRVAQCVGHEFRKEEDADDAELLESALSPLMETARSEIHKVLLAEFGGESLLFVSPWNTVDYGGNEDPELLENDSEDADVDQESEVQRRQTRSNVDIDWRENADSILHDVTGQKLAAFLWIQEGMYEVH